MTRVQKQRKGYLAEDGVSGSRLSTDINIIALCN